MYKKLLVVLVFALLIPAPVNATTAPSTFEITGSGYGHGVGLSQIGARSKALAGETATAILNYYYKDIVIQPLDDSKILRVNVGHLLSTARVTTATPDAVVQIYSGDIGDAQDAVPLAVIPAKSALNFTILGSTVVPSISLRKKVSTLPRNRIFTVRWSGTRYLPGVEGVVSLNHSSATTRYRHGQMQVRAVKASTLGYRIEITNSVRLADEYLWGVSEVPSSWPAAALEAQAIASRSYAMSKAGIYRSSCDCDLYGEISDQKFLGFAKESEKGWGKFWKAAVTNTSGLVLTQNNLPIATYFGSSTGGLTETAVNAWGSERSYTQIVPDPGSQDPKLNPNFYKWSRTVQQSVVALAFGLPDVVSLEVVSKNLSGTVAMIRATSSTGVQKNLRGETFRSRTRIPSAYFDLVSVQDAVEPTPTPSP
jgi:SpoIID/LytB domain protein